MDAQHDADDRPTVGVAIIGSGLMAKAHTMAWRNLQAVYGSVPVRPRLVILADATDELARAGAAQFGYEEWTSSWQEAVHHPDVDIVDIVTPNFLHKDVAIAAARAGKHIWCEKPLAVTVEEAREMTEAVEAAGVKTLVGFSYLRNPGVVLSKRLVEDGRIGEPVSFTGTFAIDAMTDPEAPFTWRQDRARAGTGALGDVGAHVIAFARHLVGDIDSVAALSKTTVPSRPMPEGDLGYGEKAAAGAERRAVENDDVTIFLIRFASGAIGSIEASRVSAGRSYEVGFTLTGTEGAVRFDQQRMFELQVRSADDPEGSTGFRHLQLGPGHGDYGVLWPVPGVNISIHDLKFFEAYDLLQAISTGEEAHPNFRDGWEVERVIHAVDAAAAERVWVDVTAEEMSR